MDNIRRFYESKYFGWLIIGIIAIVAFVLQYHNVENLLGIYVLHDEFGYWGIAAFLADKDWSSAFLDVPYYSYGYSFLLIPLVRFIESSVTMYRVAVGINCLLYSSSLLISYWVICKVMPTSKRYMHIGIAVLIFVYPATLSMVQIAWPETLIYFLFWAIAAVLVRVIEKGKTIDVILLALLAMYSYTVHQRCLAIVAGVGISIVLCLINKKISIKQFVIFILIFGLCGFGHNMFKDYIKDNLWTNVSQNRLAMNDYGGRIKIAMQVFTNINRLKNFLFGLAGQIIYNIMATVGIILIFLNDTTKRLINIIKNRLVIADLNTFLHFFAIMVFLCAILISSVSMSPLYTGRLDVVLYGRYHEYCIPFVIMLGISAISQKHINIKTIITELVILVFIGLGLTPLLQNKHILIMQNSVSSIPFHSIGGDNSCMLIKMVIFVCVIVVVGILIYKYINDEHRIVKLIFLMFVCGFWLCNGIRMIGHINQGHANNSGILEVCKEVEQLNIEKICYLRSSGGDWTGDIIQYKLSDESIKLCSVENYQEINGEYALIAKDSCGLTFELLNKHYKVIECGEYSVFIPKDSNIGEELYNKDKVLSDVNKLIIRAGGVKSQNDNLDNDKVTSNGSAGYLVYGTYTTLESGDYSCTMKFDNNAIMETDVARVDILINGKVYIQEDFRGNEIQSCVVEMPFTIGNNGDRAEFRLYTYEGASIVFDEIVIEKVK